MQGTVCPHRRFGLNHIGTYSGDGIGIFFSTFSFLITYQCEFSNPAILDFLAHFG